MIDQSKKDYCLSRNIKHTPVFFGLTWDILFVTAISTMFYTNVKGLSYSNTVVLDSVLMFAGCLMCVPVSKLFERINSLVSTRIGLLGYFFFFIFVMVGQSYWVFIIAQLCLAFGYATLSVKQGRLLTDALADQKREGEYGKISGKSMSIYYIVDAVGAIVASYIYEWNPYMVYVLGILVVVAMEAYSFLFTDITKFQEKNVNITAKVETPTTQTATVKKAQKADSYLKILSSGFVVSMLVYCFFFRGAMSIYTSAYKMFLQNSVEIGSIPSWIYGYLYAGLRVSSAISSKFQFKYDLKWGVRSLIIFTFCCIITYLVNSVTFLISSTSVISIVIIILMTYVQAGLRTPHNIFVTNYLQVCMPQKNYEKLYALRTMTEYLGYAISSALYASLLTGYNDNYGKAVLTFVLIFIIPLLVTMTIYIRMLVKKYAQKYTVIKQEYVDD